MWVNYLHLTTKTNLISLQRATSAVISTLGAQWPGLTGGFTCVALQPMVHHCSSQSTAAALVHPNRYFPAFYRLSIPFLICFKHGFLLWRFGNLIKFLLFISLFDPLWFHFAFYYSFKLLVRKITVTIKNISTIAEWCFPTWCWFIPLFWLVGLSLCWRDSLKRAVTLLYKSPCFWPVGFSAVRRLS